MSSKKKKRHQEFLEREKKRKAKKMAIFTSQEAMESGDIEKMVLAMGIKLY